MKLPQILAQTVPPGIPTSRGHGDVGEEYLIAAQGISKVGETLSRAILGVAERKRKAEEARRKQEIDAETDLVGARVEMEIATYANTLSQTVTDADEYEKSWIKGVEEIKSNATTGLKHPETSPAFERKWPGIAQRNFAKMLSHKNTLVIGGVKASTTTTLDTLKQLGGFEPFTPEGQNNARAYLDTGLETIENAKPAYGAEEAEKLKIGFRDAFLAERGERQVIEDPSGFIADATTNPLYREMSPTKRNELLGRAQTGAKTQRADAEKALSEAMKTWRESVQRETQVRVDSRTLDRSWLEEYKYSFTDTELKAYHKALDEQTYGGSRGDPRIVDRLRVDLYDLSTQPGDGKPTPQQMRERLLFARRNDLVPNEFFTVSMNHLDEEIRRREGKRETERKEGQTREREFQERDYRFAMENIDRSIRMTGGISPIFDKAAEDVIARFREYIHSNSNYAGRGNRNAMDLYREELPRRIAEVDERAAARLASIWRDLNIRSSEGITASQLKAEERTMPKERWLERVRLFDEMRRIEAERLRLKGLRGGGSTTTPPTTTSPSSSNPRER